MAKIKVIIGTVTGTAVGVADHLKQTLSAEHSVETVLKASVEDILADPEELLIFCTSNTGAGDLPDTILPLYNSLTADKPDIAGREFLLINLGNSGYQTFGEAGRKLEAALTSLGAVPVAQSLVIDATKDHDPQTMAADWVKNILNPVKEQKSSLSSIAKIIFGLYLIIFMYLGTVEISDEVAATFNDLIAHAVGYALLLIVAVFAFPKQKWFIGLAAFCFAYSVLIELIQYFIPYRTLSVADIVANGVGVAIGLVIAYAMWPLIRRIQQLPAQEAA